MCYEISALIMLLIVFAHINFKKMTGSFQSRFFVIFTWVGVLNILMDLISTVLISSPTVYSALLQHVFLLVLYVMQLMLPYLLYLYILSLQNGALHGMRLRIIMGTLPFAAMLVLVIGNPWFRLLFSFTEENVYTREALYPLMYYYGLFYLLLCAVDTLVNRKQIDPKAARAVGEFVLVALAVVGIQMFYNNVLLTGFGIAASIIILLLTVQNPNEKIDLMTKTYEINGLRERLRIIQAKNDPIWLIVLSLDNLKRINHVFGMDAGDGLLIEIAEMLKRTAGLTNVFRFLGDRFAVILRSQRQYDLMLKRIEDYFEAQHSIQNTNYRMSACVCLMPKPVIQKDINYFLSFIDYFIQQAKLQGAGTRMRLNDGLIDRYERHRKIEEFLYEAIEKNLFEVYYQPIYSIKMGCFVSLEALLRLRHPELGAISPAEFIPVAEKSGQIAGVDHCSLIKVCQFLSAHREILPKLANVKFNVSPAELLDARLGYNMISIIREYGLNPKGFQFEITETAATQYRGELNTWVKIIKDAGSGLCLDDFGCGYANWNSVLALPFDVVKLDRSMLLSAMRSKEGAALYRNLFSIMTDLNFSCVAEGAETGEDIAYLKALGVNLIQGFYYSKPLCETDLLELLK